MTHHPSRKEFFARLLGVTVFASLFPKLFAQSAVAAVKTPEANAPKAGALPFVLRQDGRAVARRVDTV